MKITKRNIDAQSVRVGDVLGVWWKPRRDAVVKLAPYDGPLPELVGGQVATFASGARMTLEPGARFTRYATRGG